MFWISDCTNVIIASTASGTNCGNACAIFVASELMIEIPACAIFGNAVKTYCTNPMINCDAAFAIFGKFWIIASPRPLAIFPPTSNSLGNALTTLSAMPFTPSASLFAPSVTSPLKISARPSVTLVAAGNNSPISLFFKPVAVICIVVTESSNTADALTASSLITMP